MAHIVAARVNTQAGAEAARQALRGIGIGAADIEVFDLSDAGRHAAYPIGGDRAEDPASEDSGKGAGKGAAVGAAVGAAAGAVASVAAPIVAPAIIAGSSGAGAFVGSLAGAMRETEPGHAPEHATRRGGTMVAVHAGDERNVMRIADCLRAAGAEDVEHAEGQWRDGRWADFDPLSAPRLLHHA